MNTLTAITEGPQHEAQPSYRWPPGFAGILARSIYQSSYSPIPEVAIAATLGLLAGVNGRAFRTHTETDLALYIILVAFSGVGKDAIHNGIPEMLRLSGNHWADRFVRSENFVSGQALHRELLENPGFLNLQGEFGQKLKRIADARNEPMQAFRTILLNAYNKRYLEGKTHSNPEHSIPGVYWPALSFLGETTPGTFLECLTPEMAADGFLSRFLTISYHGPRPQPNRERCLILEPWELDYWKDLVANAVQYQISINTPKATTVRPTPDAFDKLETFELSCIDSLNATTDEFERQVWNRAHLKALKIASLLAVADDFRQPLLKLEHAVWAMTLVRQDIDVFNHHKRSGNVGLDDNAREHKLIAIMRDYLINAPKQSYKIAPGMRENYIVPRSYLQTRTTTLPAFSQHRFGAVKALDEALRSLMDGGRIIEVTDKTALRATYGYFGKAYRILELPD